MTGDLHHLAAAYALDAVTDEERRAFEAHYPTCEVCSADIAAHREVAARLAGVVAVTPPPSLRASVLVRIGEVRQLSPIAGESADPSEVVGPVWWRRHRRALAAVGAAAAAIVFFVSVMVVRPSTPPYDGVLEARDAVVTTLDGGERGTLQVIWSADRDQVAVVGNDLPPVGNGFVYELWFLRNEGVAPAGLFAPDSDGMVRVVLDVDDIDGVGWAVTIEPEGGSDQPTSDVLYAGGV
ncbi:MAG: hypothetical protein D6683_15125 [Actinomyces sp.]|nr:MAG: hypothetical protein D6683_15125 [Actinomyces sp.]